MPGASNMITHWAWTKNDHLPQRKMLVLVNGNKFKRDKEQYNSTYTTTSRRNFMFFIHLKWPFLFHRFSKCIRLDQLHSYSFLFYFKIRKEHFLANNFLNLFFKLCFEEV